MRHKLDIQNVLHNNETLWMCGLEVPVEWAPLYTAVWNDLFEKPIA